MAALGSAEAVGRALALIATLLVARLLGPRGFGEFALAQGIVLYLGVISDGGLTVWSNRQIVLRKEAAASIVGDTLVVQTAIALCGVLLAVVVTMVLPADAHEVRIVLAAAAPFLVAQALNVTYALQAIEQMRLAGAMRVLTQLVTAVVAAGMSVVTHNPMWVVTSLWIGQAVASMASLFLVARRVGIAIVRRAPSHYATLLREALPLLGTAALYYYMTTAAAVVLGLAGKPEALGQFNAAMRLISIVPMVLGVTVLAVFQEFVRRGAYEDDRLGSLLSRLLRLGTFGATMLAVLCMAEARTIISVLFGHKYSAAVPVLQILAMSSPMFVFTLLVSTAFMATGQTRRALAIQATGAATASVLLPLCAQHGAAPTAWAFVVTLAVQCVVTAALGASSLAGSWLRQTGVETVWAVAGGAVVLLLADLAHQQMVVSAVAWLAVYVAIELARRRPMIRMLQSTSGGRDAGSSSSEASEPTEAPVNGKLA